MPTSNEVKVKVRDRLGRRGFLARAAAVGLALPAGGLLLAACGDDDDAKAAQPVDLPFLPNPQMAPPVTRRTPQTVKVELEAQDVQARLADGVGYGYWTFNGTVPGPMLRVREGDHVELTLRNKAGNSAAHNIDLHAVDGPGGGASLTLVKPGESKAFRFKAQHAGVYVYHCAVAPVAHHIANGMYGLIVVEPPAGLPPVDREFYVCQGDMYTKGATGEKGMQEHDAAKRDAEQPTYVVFNGAVDALVGDRALKAKVGERIRMFFGVGGPNLTSSFHVIGEIFDTVATHGSLTSEPSLDVQTVTVAPGGATMVEFKVDVPGTYLLVDHALSRLGKGAAGQLVVEGAENPDVFQPLGGGGTQAPSSSGSDH